MGSQWPGMGNEFNSLITYSERSGLGLTWLICVHFISIFTYFAQLKEKLFKVFLKYPLKFNIQIELYSDKY